MMRASSRDPLGDVRVLELPGATTLAAGKILADLGADVVKVEPPGGDPARRLPPLAPDHPDAPGLLWTAYSLGKRSVILDPDGAERRERLARLCDGADVLLCELRPDQMIDAGLDLDAARDRNPGLIAVCLTPFGINGPYAGRAGTDLVQMAMSGYMHMTGLPGGMPLKPSAPLQTALHAGTQAVAATLLALRRRHQTGRGTLIDQALRDTGLWMLTNTLQTWEMQGVNLGRQGSARDVGPGVRLRYLYPCRDGYVIWMFVTGHIGALSVRVLVEWMQRDGVVPEWLAALDWEQLDPRTAAPELIQRLSDAFATFFVTKDKAELLAWAIEHGVMLAPVQTVAEVLNDRQLVARDAWRTLDLGGGLGPARVPGPPVRMSAARWEPRGPAPAPGADTDAVLATWDRRATPPAAAPDASLPLAGLRVLDFSTTVAGPTAVRHLADFGAEVIKVESATHPDTLRVSTPYAGNQPGLNRSGYFNLYNAGKQSLTLNLKAAGAREVVRRLVEQADVLVEGFVPGVMDRLGLGQEQLRAWNPRLIVASHSLQGQTGPHARHRGYGQVASAMGGWYDLTGEEGGEPIGPYSAYTDFIAWPYLLTAILIALRLRDSGGAGQYIDHAQMESSSHFIAPALLDVQVTGRMLTRRGDHDDSAVPNSVYRTAGPDRWVAISARSDGEWRALCAALGQGDAARDPRFATADARRAHEAGLDALIGAWVTTADPFRLVEALQAAGVPAGVVARAEDLFADPQLEHRGSLRPLPHPEMGTCSVLTRSFRIEGSDAGPWRASPLLGEHTETIARDVLGMSDDEIAGATIEGLFE